MTLDRPENTDVLIMRDIYGEEYVAVRVTKERLYALARWCNGRLSALRDVYDGRLEFIFFHTENIPTYVNTGGWILRRSDGVFMGVDKDKALLEKFRTVGPLTVMPWFDVR